MDVLELRKVFDLVQPALNGGMEFEEFERILTEGVRYGDEEPVKTALLDYNSKCAALLANQRAIEEVVQQHDKISAKTAEDIKKIEALRSKKSQLEFNNEGLTDSLATAIRELAKAIDRYKIDNFAKLEERNKELTNALAEAQEQLKVKTEELAQTQGQLATKVEELAEANVVIANLKGSKKILEDENTDLKRQNERLTAQRDARGEELKAQVARVSELENEVNARKKEIGGLTEKVNGLLGERDKHPKKDDSGDSKWPLLIVVAIVSGLLGWLIGHNTGGSDTGSKSGAVVAVTTENGKRCFPLTDIRLPTGKFMEAIVLPDIGTEENPKTPLWFACAETGREHMKPVIARTVQSDWPVTPGGCMHQ